MLWSVSVNTTQPASWHAHEAYEFILCREDGGRLQLEQQEIPFQRGRTLLIAPALRHRYLVAPGEQIALQAICMTTRDMATHLSPALRALVEGMKAAGATWADPIGDAGRLWDLATLIREGLCADNAGESHLAWGAAGLLLACHGQHRHAVGAQDWRRHGGKIRDICLWLDAHLDEIVSLEQAASQFGISRSLLTREFRRHTGKSFVDYCNARRIEKAAMVLMSSAATITQVALASGFSNLSHFHRQFKAVYGLTPAAFRRQSAATGEAGGHPLS